jgi:hypothetical protein
MLKLLGTFLRGKNNVASTRLPGQKEKPYAFGVYDPGAASP